VVVEGRGWTGLRRGGRHSLGVHDHQWWLEVVGEGGQQMHGDSERWLLRGRILIDLFHEDTASLNEGNI
jgi:hypothetical protein